jgi:hypothetical protein
MNTRSSLVRILGPCVMLATACNSLLGNDSVALWDGDGGAVDAAAAGDAAVAESGTPMPDLDASDDGATDETAPAEAGPDDSAIAPEVSPTGIDASVDASDSGPEAAAPCASSICTRSGTVCQDAQTLATCTVDARGCASVVSTSKCPSPQSCSGVAPAAACALSCSDSCTQGQTSCTSGGLATCMLGSNGCWAYGAPTSCGVRQTCTGAAGSAACTCNADPVCRAVGAVCASGSTAASCAQDGQGCFYEATSTPCTNGACSGGVCCTNSCTTGSVSCLSTSSTQIQACTVGSNGCAAPSVTACSTGWVCERSGGAACEDPNWAEWPMPNCSGDVSNGAPNQEIYSNNGDGTVTDVVTGLVWQQALPSGTYTWGSTSTAGTAENYCSTLSLAGFSDWRLPSLIELMSLMDEGAVAPAINTTSFPGTPSNSPFWTSTPDAASSGSAWSVSSFDGSMRGAAESSAYSVRCVR